MIRIKHPPGARSCREHYERLGKIVPSSGDSPPYKFESVPGYEQSALVSNIADAQTIWVFGKFNRKIEKAKAGKLLYGRKKHCDVDVMVTYPSVLEIKYHDLPPDCDSIKRWIRLYFSEPAREPGLLLGLSVCLKAADDPVGQTKDAQDANDRLVSFYRKGR